MLTAELAPEARVRDARPGCLSGETVEFLATVPLLEGQDEADLVELARVLRRRTVREGEILWRQGDGRASWCSSSTAPSRPRSRCPAIASSRSGGPGPGEMVGEIGLLDGGEHTMSVQVTEPATVLALGRLDFAALLAAPGPVGVQLKRRLASLFTGRLRDQLAHLALSLGGERPPAAADDPALAVAELEPCGPPDSKYVRRMATFHDFDPVALWGFLTSGSYALCPPGRTLLAEGTPSTAYYLTINGAVEKVLIRGDRRIRVGLAGPGRRSATRASSTTARPRSPRSRGSEPSCSSCRATRSSSSSAGRTRSRASSST